MLRRKERRPNTTLKRIGASTLPDLCFRFLFGNNDEFRFSRIFLGATLGSILGLGVYFLIVHPMTLHEEQKINIMYGLSGTFALGWANSAYFRCSTLVLIPNLLGNEGRTYLTIAVMASIYAGPVVNLQNNFEEIARSMSCTVDQQINYTKIMWKHKTEPLKKIVKELLELSKEIRNRSSIVLMMFKQWESEVENTEGYNRTKEEELLHQEKIRSTQKKLELKTMLRCEYVVELGINKCKDWFAQKHEECMRVIWLPVLNSLLCLPMKFSFFCNVIYLVNKWCKERLPLEGNFGQAFDLVNKTMYNLGKNFTSAIVMRKEEHTVLFGVNISQLTMTEEVMETVKKKQVWVLRKMAYINTIMSCMFIFIFISAYSYTFNYNTNILHDNFYITTYFRQIDARRRKLKKNHLLPFPNMQKVEFVYPFNLCVQKLEIDSMMAEIWQCIPFFFVFVLTMGFDRFLIHSFQIIHKHFQITNLFPINRRLDVTVRGDTFVARLLQRTVEAFNSTPSTIDLGDNTMCLPNPSIMSFTEYMYSSWPTIGLLLLCPVQIYSNRLRRVIASFFFPKREKQRVLFLYNHHLRKKRFYFYKIRWKVMKKSRSRQIWEKTFFGRFHKYFRWTRLIFPWRCFACGASRNKDSYECQSPRCCTVYCYHCWRDLDRVCWACIPYKQHKLNKEYGYIYDLM
ncbi:E3 ubiquitin-protein ligase DCST1 isoform X2 [Dendropsophus ebraccatus]|uniref:E3 ubiquitin-protein ligase DCST1 isoform X2 n=1 Tax=Dendropsophus ebraccatus TaxID=150705 RepID=UPI0038318594